MTTLRTRIQEQVQAIIGRHTSAWLVWCDPHGHCLPLLERAIAISGQEAVPLATVGERIQGQFGGPVSRAALQGCIDSGASFVLVARLRLTT